MKTFVIVLLFCSSTQACNQKVYDVIYSKILDETLDHHLTINQKNNTIEILRQLCDGQKSRWEINTPVGLHKEVVCFQMSPRTTVVGR